MNKKIKSNTSKKPTVKQIAAICGIILILAMYVIAFVSSLFHSEAAATLNMAALACTFIVPVMLFAFVLVAKAVKPAKSPLIDGIVFDVGCVLIDFPWVDYCRSIGVTDEQLERIFKSDIFKTAWNNCDLGKSSHKELKETLLGAFPDDKDILETFLDNIADQVYLFPYTMNWIRDLKNAGYKLYVLSNWSDWIYEAAEKKGCWSFLPYMDGIVFSHLIHMVKPDPAIFDHLIDKEHLDPSRCIYLDDNKENTAAGKAAGFNTITFTTYADAKEKMNSLGVRW